MTLTVGPRPLTNLEPGTPGAVAPADVRVGVIGYGYWGPNLVRNFSEVAGAEMAVVADLSPERLAQVRGRYPAVRLTTDVNDLIEDPTLDAVVIATPVRTHFDLAMKALHAGKHVLVEKPMACTVEQGRMLVDTADRLGLTLMVDHTFVYTGAVRKIRELVDQDRLGRLYYYDSVRVNLGLFQHDVDVLWDLAVHDLSIMDYILVKQPHAVAATGAAHIAGKPVNTAYLTCFFEDSLIAHFHVNWLAPVKIRQTLIGGEKQMVVYDDLEPSEKIKVYDKGVTLNGDAENQYNLLVGYRAGDMYAPQLPLTEGLRVEAQHFLDCIQHNKRPTSDGRAGLRVLRILAAASESLANGGRPVELSPDGDLA